MLILAFIHISKLPSSLLVLETMIVPFDKVQIKLTLSIVLNNILFLIEYPFNFSFNFMISIIDFFSKKISPESSSHKSIISVSLVICIISTKVPSS